MGQIRENKYQAHVIKRLHSMFPECIVMKNDPLYIQGIPDLIVLNGDKWVALEVKRSASASHRPNQDFYVKKMNSMSYATYIYPENEEEVFYEIQRSFKA